MCPCISNIHSCTHPKESHKCQYHCQVKFPKGQELSTSVLKLFKSLNKIYVCPQNSYKCPIFIHKYWCCWKVLISLLVSLEVFEPLTQLKKWRPWCFVCTVWSADIYMFCSSWTLLKFYWWDRMFCTSWDDLTSTAFTFLIFPWFRTFNELKTTSFQRIQADFNFLLSNIICLKQINCNP